MSRAQAQKPRVLVIEDNLETRLYMQYAIDNRFDVKTASTAQEALHLAKTELFDIFLVDIALGGRQNGIHVLRAIRGNPLYAHVPIVAVTAYALPGDRAHFLEIGFDEYLGKPFKQAALIEVLERHTPPAQPQG
ncbi:MAG: response regulator [Rhodothermales bacterium]